MLVIVWLYIKVKLWWDDLNAPLGSDRRWQRDEDALNNFTPLKMHHYADGPISRDRIARDFARALRWLRENNYL